MHVWQVVRAKNGKKSLIVPRNKGQTTTDRRTVTYSFESELRLKPRGTVMVATLSLPTDNAVSSSHVSQCAHWRQVKRCSTVESAEQEIARLRAQGIDALLSMVDGLCVLAPTQH
jgi:hypothetical protein